MDVFLLKRRILNFGGGGGEIDHPEFWGGSGLEHFHVSGKGGEERTGPSTGWFKDWGSVSSCGFSFISNDYQTFLMCLNLLLSSVSLPSRQLSSQPVSFFIFHWLFLWPLLTCCPFSSSSVLGPFLQLQLER